MPSRNKAVPARCAGEPGGVFPSGRKDKEITRALQNLPKTGYNKRSIPGFGCMRLPMAREKSTKTGPLPSSAEAAQEA